MEAIKIIEDKMGQLSPGLIVELDQYVDYLISKKMGHNPRKLLQDWAGGLKDIKISALELQKMTFEWNGK